VVFKLKCLNLGDICNGYLYKKKKKNSIEKKKLIIIIIKLKPLTKTLRTPLRKLLKVPLRVS